MASDFSMRTNADEFIRVFKAFPIEMLRRGKNELGSQGGKYISALQREHLTGGTSRDRLGVGTGDLRRSFKHVVVGHDLDSLALIVTSSSKYAAIHEYGGVIKPKRAKMLAIPLEAAKTEAGVARWPGPRSPGAPPMHLIATGRSVLLVHSISGEPMYLLVSKVTIPARLHARDTMDKRLPLIVKGLAKTAEDAWRRLT